MDAFKGLPYSIDTKKMLPSIMVYNLGIGDIFRIYNWNFNEYKSFPFLLLAHYKPRIRGNSNPYYLTIDKAIGKETMLRVIAIKPIAIETCFKNFLYCHFKNFRPYFSGNSGGYFRTRQGQLVFLFAPTTMREIPALFGIYRRRCQCRRITPPRLSYPSYA